MSTFAVDSNCMVAFVLTGHVHHDPVWREVTDRLNDGQAMVVPAPALVEAYAVLTRMPSPYKLAPESAWQMLQVSFGANGRVHALDGHAYMALLTRASAAGVLGGRIYDAVIAECAKLAGATTLVTINLKRIDPPPGVAIVDPTLNPNTQ